MKCIWPHIGPLIARFSSSLWLANLNDTNVIEIQQAFNFMRQFSCHSPCTWHAKTYYQQGDQWDQASPCEAQPFCDCLPEKYCAARGEIQHQKLPLGMKTFLRKAPLVVDAFSTSAFLFVSRNPEHSVALLRLEVSRTHYFRINPKKMNYVKDCKNANKFKVCARISMH